MTRLDCAALSVIAAAVFILAGVIALESLTPVNVVLSGAEAAETAVSPYGALRFSFSRPVLPHAAAQAFWTEPEISGRWSWQDGRHVTWHSLHPLPPGASLRFGFRPESVGENGERFSENAAWEASIRRPQILYLSFREEQNLFRLDPFVDEPALKLTNFADLIFAYEVSPDGENMILCLINPQRGIDFRLLSRDGGEPELLLDCGKDRCTAPHWSFETDEVIYTREQAPASPKLPFGLPRPWVLSLKSGKTAPLFEDPQEIGYGALPSPGGRWISYWNGLKGGIVLYDRQTQKSDVVPSMQGNAGSWSPDGKRLAHTIYTAGTQGSRTLIQWIDAESGATGLISTPELEAEEADLSNPLWNPDGRSILATVRRAGQTIGGELWAIPLEGDDAQVFEDVTDRLRVLASWDPSGTALLYKSDDISGGSSGNKLMVWNLNGDGKLQILAEDVNIPVWLP